MKRRNTPTKQAVMSVLTAGKAMSQDAIERNIKMDIDRVTIYRILNRFCEDGIVHRIVAEDGKQYFAICAPCEGKKPTSHHFHFRCTRCQTIECLQSPVHFTVPRGYQVETANCVLTGVCRSCAAQS